MSIETDTSVLVNLLDPPPEISHHEAKIRLREHIPPRDIRNLRHTMEIFRKCDPDAFEIARQNGPEWLTSDEGHQWLRDRAEIHIAAE